MRPGTIPVIIQLLTERQALLQQHACPGMLVSDEARHAPKLAQRARHSRRVSQRPSKRQALLCHRLYLPDISIGVCQVSRDDKGLGPSRGGNTRACRQRPRKFGVPLANIPVREPEAVQRCPQPQGELHALSGLLTWHWLKRPCECGSQVVVLALQPL